jgi:hypothetical protein
MVGTRRNLLSKTSSYGNGNGTESIQRDDVESSYGTINNIKPTHRFRDAIKQTMYTNRANDMKRKLIDNVDHEELEIYRKSAESVRESEFLYATELRWHQFFQLKCIPNKELRAFYEEQNRRLDDWLEVDMVVSSLADDIVDSMHPRDTDGDGVAEERGPLGSSGEDLEPFLPEEEREKRRTSAKHVRWAINVSLDNIYIQQ